MRVRYGMAHGRFQPFHRGHLEYVLAGLARSEHLIVGITNPDPWQTRAEAADAQRHTPEANPFTFFERQHMTRAALHEAGADPRRVSLVPFPIHEPERWAHYCPRETVQFVRVFSAWGREKVARLRAAGWRVEVLEAGHAKQISGRTVRRCLRENDGWRDLVPPGVAAVLDEIGARERCRETAESGEGRSDEEAPSGQGAP